MITTEVYTMHPDQRALMEGILKYPNDDALRLIYAKWIRDHGDDERADFIEGKSPGEGRRTKGFRTWDRSHWRHCWPFIRVNSRVEPYFVPADQRDAVTNLWKYGSCRYVDHALIRLGFVDALQTTIRRFNQYGRDWFTRNPIRAVLLTELDSPNDGITANGTPWAGKPQDQGYFQSWSSDDLPEQLVHFLSPKPDYIFRSYYSGKPRIEYCYLTKDGIRRAVSNAAVNYQRSVLGLPPI